MYMRVGITQCCHIRVNLGQELETGVSRIKNMIKADGYVGVHFSPRYLAIKMLEHDSEAQEILKNRLITKH